MSCAVCSFVNLPLSSLCVNPRIPQILTSNLPLSSSDTAIIDDGLAALAEDRSRLVELIAAAQATLAEMQESLSCVDAAIEMHEAFQGLFFCQYAVP